MKIFAISLIGSMHRKVLSESLEAIYSKVEIFDAFDARPASLLDIKDLMDSQKIERNMGRQLAKPEIGCAISHLQLYEKMLAENIELMLVFEDDAIVDIDFCGQIKSFFANRNTIPTVLSMFSGEAICTTSFTYANDTILKCLLPPTHTVCYALNAAAAKLFIDETGGKVTATADWPPVNGVNYFVYREQFVKHNVAFSSIADQRSRLNGISNWEMALQFFCLDFRFIRLFFRNVKRWIFKRISQFSPIIVTIRHRDGV